MLSSLLVLGVCIVSLVFAVVAIVTKQKAHQQPKSLDDGMTVHAPRLLPSTLPILGNLLELARNTHRFHDWMTECCEFFEGDTFAMEMPGRLKPIFIYTPKNVEDVLKTQFETIGKGPFMRSTLFDVFGEGIFAVDGVQWAHQRKKASHLFSTNALRKGLESSVERSTNALLRVLTTTATHGQTIDVYKLMSRFSIQAFAKMGFGVDLDCLECEDDHPFQAAFDSAQRILTQRFIRPSWLWKLQRALGVGLEAQLKREIAVIDNTVMDIIAQSLERRQRLDHEEGGDIVSLFLEHTDVSNDHEFDPKYLRDIVVNFLIAGRDSTAQTMSWLLYNLSNHPEILEKIRSEIALELPDIANGRRTSPPTMDEVQGLVYLEATLKENLRLYPTVPVLPKAVLCDTVLADGTFLPAGTEITIPTYAMGRMDFIWGPDAKAFKPERWIDPTTGKLRPISAFQFVSFNAGPRTCLGMNLALIEMKIVLASVLSRFTIELVPNQHVTYDRSMTLPIRGEMRAVVKPV